MFWKTEFSKHAQTFANFLHETFTNCATKNFHASPHLTPHKLSHHLHQNSSHKSHLTKCRNGCATSEDLFWKLDALQSFIRDLHWPDAEFRQHLEQRLKLMACDMIESCLQRTEQSFQQWLKKSVTFISTDYIISTEMCAMVNVILDAKNQSFKLCSVDGIDVVSYCFVSQVFTTENKNEINYKKILHCKENLREAFRLTTWRTKLSRQVCSAQNFLT